MIILTSLGGCKVEWFLTLSWRKTTENILRMTIPRRALKLSGIRAQTSFLSSSLPARLRWTTQQQDPRKKAPGVSKVAWKMETSFWLVWSLLPSPQTQHTQGSLPVGQGQCHAGCGILWCSPMTQGTTVGSHTPLWPPCVLLLLSCSQARLLPFMLWGNLASQPVARWTYCLKFSLK